MAESIVPDGQGKVVVNYVRAGNPMQSSLHVRLGLVVGVYRIVNVAGTEDMSLAALWTGLLDSLFLPLIPTATTVTTLELWRYLNGAYYSVEGTTVTAAGTGAEAPDPCPRV